MDDIYKNIEEYNPNKKHKMLIVFYYIIRLKNEFVFPDPEPPIINILYGRSGIC